MSSDRKIGVGWFCFNSPHQPLIAQGSSPRHTLAVHMNLSKQRFSLCIRSNRPHTYSMHLSTSCHYGTACRSFNIVRYPTAGWTTPNCNILTNVIRYNSIHSSATAVDTDPDWVRVSQGLVLYLLSKDCLSKAKPKAPKGVGGSTRAIHITDEQCWTRKRASAYESATRGGKAGC
jgi:hypothetical protein